MTDKEFINCIKPYIKDQEFSFDDFGNILPNTTYYINYKISSKDIDEISEYYDISISESFDITKKSNRNTELSSLKVYYVDDLCLDDYFDDFAHSKIITPMFIKDIDKNRLITIMEHNKITFKEMILRIKKFKLKHGL